MMGWKRESGKHCNSMRENTSIEMGKRIRRNDAPFVWTESPLSRELVCGDCTSQTFRVEAELIVDSPISMTPRLFRSHCVRTRGCAPSPRGVTTEDRRRGAGGPLE